MKLNDREILELNTLCGAVVDGTLTDAQRERLARWLAESEAVRRYYVRALDQSASLYIRAAEIHADAPDRRPSGRRLAPVIAWTATLAAAAVVAGVMLYQKPTPRTALGAAPSVARVTGAKDARFADGRKLAPGDHVALGQRIELKSGVAEITFDSGARVVLQGAASMEVNSAWDATLRRGTLKATVPPQAIGFRVTNPAVEVVDLGTEFTITADANGAAEVLVLKGEVEAAPRATAEADTILLREQEGRRFAASGVSAVSDSEAKFAAARKPYALQRFTPPMRFLHWSFDEPAGAVIAANDGRTVAAPAVLEFGNVSDDGSRRIDGRFGRGLRFDGELQVSGPVAGLSAAVPHTIAFWVRVPEEAALSDAYAMVAWATNLTQLGSRPVQISWNRRPAEGTLGALRTDFGGGCAIGTTSLRDGRWHHVTVIFSPGGGDGVPVQVKQYLDGRLESSTIIPGRIRAPAGTGDAARLDVVWLGCRLTGHQQRDRFRGEMDELFIADGTLEPDEIVRLGRDNRLEATGATAIVHTEVPSSLRARILSQFSW